MGKNKAPVGLLLIAVAIFLLLGKLGIFTIMLKVLWPLLILAAGVLLHYLYFRHSWPAVSLVPAGIILTYSILFMIGAWFGWDTMRFLWPGYLFGIAVGLYEWSYYDRGYTGKGVYQAALILGALSVILFLLVVIRFNIVLLSFTLLAIGLVLLVLWWRAK